MCAEEVIANGLNPCHFAASSLLRLLVSDELNKVGSLRSIFLKLSNRCVVEPWPSVSD
jgi:hypothetical protein